MDFNKPCVIQEDFLCLYLLNFTHLLGMCLFLERKISLHSILLAGQITRRVAPSVAPSTGCIIIIIILFFRMNIVH